jgi:hypothetical protein
LDLRGGAVVEISRCCGWRVGLFFFVLMGGPLVGTRLAPPGAVPPGGRPDPQVGRLFLCAHVIITPAELRFVHSQQACITYHLLSTPINFDFKRSSVGGDGGGWEAVAAFLPYALRRSRSTSRPRKEDSNPAQGPLMPHSTIDDTRALTHPLVRHLLHFLNICGSAIAKSDWLPMHLKRSGSKQQIRSKILSSFLGRNSHQTPVIYNRFS